jgi:hypothetical protein
MRVRCLVVAVALACLAGAPDALAQTQAPNEPPPGPGPGPPPPGPAVPELVLSGRDVRLTRTGFAHVRVGCRPTGAASEACLGTLILRLSKPLTFDLPGGRKGRVSPTKTIGLANFETPVGQADLLTVRVDPMVQRALRSMGSLTVQLLASYVGRSGQAGSAQRYVSFYFPSRPPF